MIEIISIVVVCGAIGLVEWGIRRRRPRFSLSTIGMIAIFLPQVDALYRDVPPLGIPAFSIFGVALLLADAVRSSK